MEEKRQEAPEEETPQVEDQESHSPEDGLHRSAEEEEGQHIHEEVPDAPMQEAGGDHLVPSALPQYKPGRDGIVADHIGRGQSPDASEGGDPDNQQVDAGRMASHSSPPAPSPTMTSTG